MGIAFDRQKLTVQINIPERFDLAIFHDHLRRKKRILTRQFDQAKAIHIKGGRPEIQIKIHHQFR